jgi:predicted N-formylglutamate amidohydrolase
MSTEKAVDVVNAEGSSPFVLVCDHASNRLPARYGTLGLTPEELISHIAWDPGAQAVSLAMVEALDAPLVQSTVSRLIIDCNRDLDAPDLIWTLSERTRIAANENLEPQERQFRIDAYHRPFHEAIDAVIAKRLARGQETVLVCMHSFTPVYHGVPRPWPIGLIHGVDTRFTRAVADALAADDPTLNVGWNEPYAALNGVTLTLEKHGDARGLAAVMVEIRNDEIADPAGVTDWAGRLGRALHAAHASGAADRAEPAAQSARQREA